MCTAKNMVPIYNVAVLAILLFVPSSYGQEKTEPIQQHPTNLTQVMINLINFVNKMPNTIIQSQNTTESPFPNPVSKGSAMWIPLLISLVASTLILLNGMRFASLYSKTWLANPNKQKIVFILALAISFIILAIWITLNTAFVPVLSVSNILDVGYKYISLNSNPLGLPSGDFKISELCDLKISDDDDDVVLILQGLFCSTFTDQNNYIIAAAVLGGIFPLWLMAEAFFSIPIFIQVLEILFYFFGTILVNGQILAKQINLKNASEGLIDAFILIGTEGVGVNLQIIQFGDAYIFAVVCIVLQIVLFCLTGWLIWMRYTKV